MLAERELDKADFSYALELSFRPEGSTDSLYPTPPHKLKHPFKFKDYMPKVRVGARKEEGLHARRQLNLSSLSLSLYLSMCVCVCAGVPRHSRTEQDRGRRLHDLGGRYARLGYARPGYAMLLCVSQEVSG